MRTRSGSALRLGGALLIGLGLLAPGITPLPGGSDGGAGDADSARRCAREALREAARRHGAGSRETATALVALADALLGGPQPDPVEAVALARRGIEILESVDGATHPQIAAALDTLGFGLWLTDRPESTRSIFERALAIREGTLPPDEAGIARDLHFLSEIDRIAGDYGRAIQIRERIGPLLERSAGPSTEEMAVHLRYLAMLRQTTGDLHGAVALAARSASLREAILDPTDPRLAASLNLWGSLLVDAGDLVRAEAPLRRALSIWEASPTADPVDVARALQNLGRLLAGRGELAAAASRLERALAIRVARFPFDHPLVARSLSDLAAVEWRLGAVPSARERLERAIAIQRRSPASSRRDLGLSVHELARLEWHDGNGAAALRGALEAERLAREFFSGSSVGLTEREALNQGRARDRGLDDALAWATDLASRGNLGDDDASSVLDGLIGSRSMVLDGLATRHRILALHADEETVALVESLRQARGRLTFLRLEAASARTGDASWQRLREAIDAADRAERALAEKSRGFRREIERGRPDLDEIRALLPRGSALVSYVRYRMFDEGAGSAGLQRYVALVQRADDPVPRLVPLGAADELDDAVETWSLEVSRDPRLTGLTGAEAAYRRAARRLGAAIWDPVGPWLEGLERVIVVPDGELHRVNFATLLTPDGDYLVETGPALHYLTAERDIAVTRDPAPPGHGILVVGDPEFGAGGDADGFGFDSLPGARREAAEVAAHATFAGRPTLLTGSAASEASFKRLAPTHRVLHVATHAFFGPGTEDSPLRVSGLALTGAGAIGREPISNDGDDGLLTAEEIALLDLRHVEWTVLSACATGRGALEMGEGVLGLRRAFQIAGARTLILSLWRVEDEATRHWMRELYAARGSGATTVEAVRGAARRLLGEQRRSYGTTHPYYWGGFISVGDWR